MLNGLVVNEKVYFPFKKISFVVVGGGGNGSYLIRDLARIVAVNNEQYNREDNITIIDQDIVELKNLNRQNFVNKDIGKNKAFVLANRYSKAYGVDISSIEEYITKDNVYEIFSQDNMNATTNAALSETGLVIIGCVDNNKTRDLIHNFYRNNSRRVVYIDVGNEEYAGQVVLSFNHFVNSKGNAANIKRGKQLVPDIVEHFGLKPDDKHPDELSCAEHAVSAPQNIGTNIMAAETVFGLCNLILAGAVFHNSPQRQEFIQIAGYGYEHTDEYKEFMKKCPMISSHIIFFNSRTGQKEVKYFPEDVQDAIRRA